MDEEAFTRERRKLLLSMLIPFFFVVLLWLVMFVGRITGSDLHLLGIFPWRVSSLTGIITSPFIHADLKHLYSNTLPLFVLGTALFYFYSQVAFRVVIWITLFTGLSVWLTGRPAWHIGASGIIYGLAAFLFVSGIIRRHIPLMALSLLVVFLYGGMVWGIFPGFRPEISWESHMLGAAAGMILALWFRSEGPQRPVPFYEENEDFPEEENEDNGYNQTD